MRFENELKKIFEVANKQSLKKEKLLILDNVSERTLCAALMCYFKNELSSSKYNKYYVDVEYNRNQGEVKTIINENMEIISVTCDLIVHSRGTIVEHDNLIALEMKKSNRPTHEKTKDKNRLIALTKSSYDDIWSFDGETLPEHVCGYLLGIYYEINISRRLILLEFYKSGMKYKEQIIKI